MGRAAMLLPTSARMRSRHPSERARSLRSPYSTLQTFRCVISAKVLMSAPHFERLDAWGLPNHPLVVRVEAVPAGEAMTQTQNMWHQPWHSSFVRGEVWPRIGSIGLGISVGMAYLLAARFSLALLTKPDCVAVFWPAAGIATGTLIALGPKARLPVTLAVLGASAAAGLL